MQSLTSVDLYSDWNKSEIQCCTNSTYIGLIKIIYKRTTVSTKRELKQPSIFPRTRLTAPTQPSQDMPTLSTTVCITEQNFEESGNTLIIILNKRAQYGTCSKPHTHIKSNNFPMV